MLQRPDLTPNWTGFGAACRHERLEALQSDPALHAIRPWGLGAFRECQLIRVIQVFGACRPYTGSEKL